jgi:hypothetical protein
MNRVMCATTFATLLCASAASAQGPAQAGPVSLSMSLQRSYAAIKNNLTLAADKLSEADYGFKPSSMPEVRTFGQLFGHVANAQFNACSAARGVPNPNMGINNEQKKTKAEIVKALADSFAHCDPAFTALTEENGSQVMAQGRGQVARSAILAGLVSHSNEMYGTASVYLRAKNVVPPSTEGAQQPQQPRAGGPGRGGQ